MEVAPSWSSCRGCCSRGFNVTTPRSRSPWFPEQSNLQQNPCFIRTFFCQAVWKLRRLYWCFIIPTMVKGLSTEAVRDPFGQTPSLIPVELWTLTGCGRRRDGIPLWLWLGRCLAPSHSLLFLCWLIMKSFSSSLHNSIYYFNYCLFLTLCGY